MNPMTQNLWTAVALLAAGAAGAAWLLPNLQGDSANALTGKKTVSVMVNDASLKREMLPATSFAPMVKKVAPSVVNVFSTKKMQTGTWQEWRPFFDDPLFRRFFGEPFEDGSKQRRPRPHPERSLGSGVIVSPDGYILTNDHVVDGADEIKVLLEKDKKEYTAKVVGRDPRTDIAVLKIEATGLPAVVFGDSDKVEVGDVVLAIGNPFGIGQTVTSGIVSATKRGGMGIEDYEDFIQTDASINPGNSGGALVDLRGRLIGINTAISSTSGSNSGVGFAIPINLVRTIAEQLVANGRVVRGYLGVQIQQITPEIQNSLNLPDRHGALVGDVTSGGPAARAGIQRGDVIRTINGTAVKDMNDLRLRIASTPPGQQVRLGLWREGRERTVTATLDELPAEFQLPSERTGSSSRTGAVSRLGLTVTNASEAAGRRGGETQTGVLVTAVDPNGPAASRGLRQGDIIQEVNLQPVANVQEFERKIAAVKAGDSVLLLVKRDNSTLFIGVTIPN